MQGLLSFALDICKLLNGNTIKFFKEEIVMDSMEKVTGSILAEAKEAAEGALLIGLISHYTGYAPDNITEETAEYMANFDQFITEMCEDIVLKLDTDEIRKLINLQDEVYGIFKQELFNLMKEMENL